MDIEDKISIGFIIAVVLLIVFGGLALAADLPVPKYDRKVRDVLVKINKPAIMTIGKDPVEKRRE